MTKEQRLEGLAQYIERTKQVLNLSAPLLAEIENAEDYRVHMQESFREIGGLAMQNIDTLKECLFPLLAEDYELSDDDADVLRQFSAMMIDTTSMENIDLPLIYELALKLMQDAEKSGDVRKIIISADNMVVAACMMMNLSIRFYPDVDVCFYYRDIGLKAGYRILEYLEKDKFAALPDDECKELVLINSRYIRCLFEWDDKKGEEKEAVNREEFHLMDRALAIAEDPFYREQMPDYLWDTHTFRTLQYLSDFTEDGNCHEYSQEHLAAINGYTKRLISFLEEHPDLVQGCPVEEQKLYVARNGYFAGEISVEEYQDKLTKIMLSVDPSDFSGRAMFVSFSSALEYIYSLDKDNLTDEQNEIIRLMYRDIASYAYRMPKTGVLSFMLTFLCMLLKDFVEVTEGISFRAMCRQLIAAMHPPTYVHTLNVAAIARYLAGKLIEKHPDMFCGIEGAANVADVLNRKGELEDFVYNSALLHDIGKLFIVETIMAYGRNLLDTEFEFIKAHTVVGAALLRRFDETAKYADVALGHQLWYDGTGGYPEEAKNIDPKSKIIVDIVAAADCIDAATDSVGRSYKRGLSYEEICAELREGSGTRYAPYVVELLDDPSTSRELQRILTEGRDENYRITFGLLKDL